MAYVMLVKGTSWIARLIQKATGSPYSHCEIVINKTCYSSDVGGVQVRSLDSYPWEYDLYAINGMNAFRETLMFNWCRKQVGAPYDYGKVIGMGLDILLHTCGFRPLLDSRRAFTCAEFVWMALAQSGLPPNVNLDEVQPGSFAKDRRLFAI